MTQGTLQRWMIANPLKTFNTQKLGISGDTTISDLVVTPRQATIFKGLTIWFIEDAGVKTP